MYKNRNNKQPDFITHEDLIQKLGYRTPKAKGLSVYAIRKNKRETILSVASSYHWSISWLQKQLDKHFGFDRHYKQFKGNIRGNGKSKK